MKVFVTGATGFVGSRVLPLLASAGHEVVALVRSSEHAEKLKARNVQPLLGDLLDPHSLNLVFQAASEAEAVIHLAFIHDFVNYEASCLVDVRVSQAVIQALAGIEVRQQVAATKPLSVLAVRCH